MKTFYKTILKYAVPALMLLVLLRMDAYSQANYVSKNTATAAGTALGNNVSDISNAGTVITRINDDNTVINFPMIGIGKTVSAPVIQADGSYDIDYTITVKNFGASVLNSVQVTDNLANTFPAPLTFTFRSANTATGGLTVNGSFDGDTDQNLLSGTNTLAAGSTATITIKLNVKPNGSYGTFNNTARVTAKTDDDVEVFDESVNNNNPDANGNNNPFDDASPTPVTLRSSDIEVKKIVDNSTPLAGSNVVFTITATNKGTGDAAPVAVNDLLPAGFTFVSADDAPAYNSTSGVWSAGTLNVNASKTLKITAKVEANRPAADYVNTASVNHPGDPVSTNNTSTVTVTPVPSADLKITNTDGKTSYTPGTSNIYTIVVTNAGPSNVTGAKVTNPLPAGTGSWTAVYSGGASGTASGTGGINETVDIPSGGTITYTFTVDVPSNYTGNLTSTAHVEPPTGVTDPTPADNTAADTDTQNSITDLAVTKTVDNKTPDVGTDVVFTITVENKGASDATGVKVTDALPAGYAYKGSVPSTGTYNSGTGEWTIGNLAASASVSMTVTATVNPDKTAAEYKNTAQVSGNETDSDITNNSDDEETTPVAVADLAVEKTVDNNTPNAGDNVVFTLKASNAGPSNATGVKVTDLLPAGYTFVSASAADYNSASGEWTVGNLASGADETITITATVNPDKTAADYKNTASVSGNEKDLDTDNNTDEAETTPVPLVDLSIVKTVDNGTPDAGTDITFTLTVGNAGPSTAANVEVTDILPAGYTFKSAVPSAGSYDSSTGKWAVGSLAASAGQTLALTVTVNPDRAAADYTNTASVSSTETDSDPLNNTDDESTVPVQVVDLSLEKTVDNKTPDAGTDVIFTLKVKNEGPSTATNTKATDVLPAGYTFISAVPTVGTYDNVSGEWSIGNLASGGEVSITITAKVNPDKAAADYQNTASVTGTEKDSDTGNNSDDEETTPVPVVDLAVEKTVDNNTPNAGDNVVFTLKASNAGPSNATGVKVTDLLPAGYTFVSASAADYNSASGEWTIGNLASGADETITITAKVNPDKAAADYKNTASVTGSEKDPDTDNNTDEAETTPVPIVDLSIVKTVDNGTPDAGTDITFTLAVSNAGPSTAANVEVTDVIPAGYTFKSAVPSAGSYDSSTGRWAVGSLAANAGQTLALTVTVNPDKAAADYTNSASVSSTETDSDPLNNTDDESTVPVQVVDLSIEKTVDNKTPDAGTNVIFTITVKNAGPSTATNVIVTDVLPAGYTFVSASAADYNAGTGEWSIGNLASGGEVSITITAKVNPDQTAADYKNTASVTGTEKDSDTGNNSDDEETTPVAVANLAVEKTVDNITPNADTNVSFTLRVTNNGPSNATNVKVDDLLPAGYIFVSAAPSTGTYNNTSGVWTIGNLSANTDAVMVVTVKVIAGKAAADYENTASVSGTEKDPDTDNNTDKVTVNRPPLANDNEYTAYPSIPLDMDILINDEKGSAELVPGSIQIIQQPQHGQLTVNPNGTVTYLAEPNYDGPDNFTYTVTDENGAVSNVANVKITVNGKPVVGLAKAATSVVKAVNGTYDITYLFTVGNYGLVDLGDVRISDDLSKTFPGANIKVNSVMALGNLKVNNGYDGVSNIQLLGSGNELKKGQVEQLEIKVNVNVSANGSYLNKATAQAKAITGQDVEDQSNNGLNPVPNGGDDVSPDEPTPIVLNKPKVRIPEGFSPNNDGNHDKLIIENNGFRRISIEIFNRWGNRVYRSADYQNDWDGKCTEGIHMGEDVPDGTYFYIVVVDNEKYAGYLTISR